MRNFGTAQVRVGSGRSAWDEGANEGEKKAAKREQGGKRGTKAHAGGGSGGRGGGGDSWTSPTKEQKTKNVPGYALGQTKNIKPKIYPPTSHPCMNTRYHTR